MVHKFSRISNYIVFCVLQEISKRDDHMRPKERNLKEWLQDREAAMGANQAVLTFARSNVHRRFVRHISGPRRKQSETGLRRRSSRHRERNRFTCTARTRQGVAAHRPPSTESNCSGRHSTSQRATSTPAIASRQRRPASYNSRERSKHGTS